MPPRLRTSAAKTFLVVEWMEGAESRGGDPPQVLIDGRAAGPVDAKLPIRPGEHRVSVRDVPCKAKPSEIAITVAPDHVVVLEYHAGERDVMGVAVRVLLAFACFGLIRLLKPDLLTTESGEKWAWAAAGIIALGLMYAVRVLWQKSASPKLIEAAEELHAAAMGGNLGPQFVVQAAYPSSPKVRDADADDEDCNRQAAIRDGRILVHMLGNGFMTSVHVDGKPAGKVGDVLRVPAGRRHVRINGWFERSRPFEINVSQGELVELDAKPTKAGVLAMLPGGLVGAAGIWLVVATEPEALMAWIFGVIAAAGALLLIAALLTTTRELQLKR